jgi:hypothetical protein
MLGIKDLRQHITKYVNDILGLYALNLIQLLVIALSEASGICSGKTDFDFRQVLEST